MRFNLHHALQVRVYWKPIGCLSARHPCKHSHFKDAGSQNGMRTGFSRSCSVDAALLEVLGDEHVGIMQRATATRFTCTEARLHRAVSSYAD